jgi:hypothetical protein
MRNPADLFYERKGEKKREGRKISSPLGHIYKKECAFKLPFLRLTAIRPLFPRPKYRRLLSS